MKFRMAVGVFLALIMGCSSENPVQTLTLNRLTLTLDMTQAPSNIVEVRATLSRDGFTTRTISLGITESTASGVFENVPIGSWHLRVDALDSEDVVKFTGETYVEIVPGGTTRVDLILNPADGSIEVNVRWGSGLSGNALRFDGENDYAIVADPSSLNDVSSSVTMEAWVRPYEREYNAIMVQGYRVYALEFARGLRPGALLNGVAIDYTGARNDHTRLLIFDRVPELVWSHIAFTFDADQGVKFYINGELAYETTSTGEIDNSVEFGYTAFRIGARDWSPDGDTIYFRGDMDEVRVWNITRTQEQIQGSMFSELSGGESGLVGYWRFNEEPGATIVRDASPNGNDAELMNGVQLVPSTVF